VITAETLHRIIHFDAHGLPVVSLYVPVPADPGERSQLRSRVASLLDRIRPVAEDPALTREARLSVREDITRLETLLAGERWMPQGMALFLCSGAGLLEEVRLPRSVRDRVVVDATPWVRPLAAVLDEYHRTLVAVIDEKSADFWELFQADIRHLSTIEDRALRKPDYAGWYGLDEHRVSNKSEELAKRHFVQVAQLIDELFRDGDYELLVIGGHDDEVARFRGFLPAQLRRRVAGTFSIDAHTATERDIRLLASEPVERYERDEERRKVAEVVERVAAGQPAALGLADCLWAATTADVQELLVHNDVTAPGVVCQVCGWLGEAGEVCPVCGADPRHEDDIIDELVERVLDDGGSIEHVEAETELAAHLVAASLRFPLPPLPSS
jgi:peptide subunit release factor 1 (eRF1)